MRVALIPWIWNWSAGSWAAIAAWATFAVAVVAASFARHQVLEARRTREEQAQPFVVVDFEPSEAWSGLMNLVIRNTGSTLARNVRFQFTPPLQATLSESDGQYRPREMSLLAEDIPSMPPGKEWVILFERMPDLFESDLPRRYDVLVTFDDTRGRSHSLEYILDLGLYFGITYIEVYGLHHLTKAVRDLRDAAKRWTQHGSGIRVWTRDEDRFVQRQREEFDRRVEARTKKEAAPAVPFGEDPDDPQRRHERNP